MGSARSTVCTDHEPLDGLESRKDVALDNRGLVAGWLETLAPLNVEIKYVPKEKMQFADMFSRSPAFRSAPADTASAGPRVASAATALAVEAVGPQRPAKADWRMKQLADRELSQLIAWLEGTYKGTDVAEATRIAATVKQYEMEMRNGVLVSVSAPRGKGVRQEPVDRVVPPAGDQRRRIVKEAHDHGHIGAGAMVASIRQLYEWPGIWGDCAAHKRRCYRCAANEPIRADWDPLQPTLSATLDGKRRQVVDIFGPIEGVFFAVVLDVDDGWPWVLVLRNGTAEEWADAYITHVVKDDAVMDELLSDRGSNLNAAFSQAVYKALGLTKLTTASHNPQANGRAEALVKRAKPKVVKLIQELKGKGWSLERIAARAEFYLRTTVKSPMGVTPFRARFGREAKLPAYFNQPLDHDELPPTVEQMKKEHDTIMSLMDGAAEAAKERYDEGRSGHDFKVGQLVWITDHERESAADPKRIGPFKVADTKGDLDLAIEEVDGGPRLGRRHPIVNVRHVDHFNAESWPGEQSWEVAKVVDHKGRGKGRRFLVKWSSGEETWEPLRSLVDYDGEEPVVVAALLEYWDAHPRLSREVE